MVRDFDGVAPSVKRKRKITWRLAVGKLCIMVPGGLDGCASSALLRHTPGGASGLGFDVVVEDVVYTLLGLGRFVDGPAELDGSSGQDLSVRVQVLAVLKVSGEEPVRVVVIVS